MRLHGLREPHRAAHWLLWLTRLVALACILALAAVLLTRRALPPAGCQLLNGGAGAGVDAAEAPKNASTSALRPQPVANNMTSLLVVLARHEEDIRW